MISKVETEYIYNLLEKLTTKEKNILLYYLFVEKIRYIGFTNFTNYINKFLEEIDKKEVKI